MHRTLVALALAGMAGALGACGAMQDLRVEYDNTVRDASGKIVQFLYGEDGLDVSRTEAGKINVKKIIENIE